MDLIELPEDQRWCVGYEGRYAVTCEGDVYSYLSRSRKRYSKIKRDSRERVRLLDTSGKLKLWYLDKLVALAWVPNPDNKKHIKNSNPIENHYSAEYLEWVDPPKCLVVSNDFISGGKGVRLMLNKGFSSEEDFVELLKYGEYGGYKYPYQIIDKIPAKLFKEAGVPKEMRDTRLRSNCMLDNWNFIITYLDSIFIKKMPLKELSETFYLSYTFPSHIRSGRKWKKEVEIYNKYRKNKDYIKNYKPTYNLEKA